MKLKINKLVQGERHYFFGYYGKSPWSKNEKYVVCLETDFIDRHPNKKDFVNIILINTKTGEKKKIAKTSTWNWQQGSMLQWMGPDFNSKIIFNDRKGDKFVSKIIDIKKGEGKTISYPIFDVDCSGKYATSISFEKLNEVRKGYGYSGGEGKFKKRISEKEGIYLIDLEKNKRRLIMSIKELYDFKNLDAMDKGEHIIGLFLDCAKATVNHNILYASNNMETNIDMKNSKWMTFVYYGEPVYKPFWHSVIFK